MMARFSLLPRDDAKQLFRMHRYLLASGFSLVYLFVLYVFHLQGTVKQQTLILASVLITSFIGVFYFAFRSGLNLRMPDPSLTAPMLLSAVFTMLYVVYHAPATREAFSSFLFVAFMFGMLRLSARQLGLLAAISLLAFAFVIGLRFQYAEGKELVRQDLIQWTVLALTMPWFILIGSYIRALRKDLADASIRLDDIKEQARRDELTGVFNRRVLMATMQAEKNRCDRIGDIFSICIIDIDFFKRVNDEIGHLAGDEVLRKFARAVQNGLRSIDTFGRYGGEEFIQILPHTNLNGALVYAERIRIQALSLNFSEFAKRCSITVSIGVAQYQQDESVMQTFSRADAALYSAKQAGRNRVVAGRSGVFAVTQNTNQTNLR
jgi:diguanylate cyclase (GGDEF)-like protein